MSNPKTNTAKPAKTSTKASPAAAKRAKSTARVATTERLSARQDDRTIKAQHEEPALLVDALLQPAVPISSCSTPPEEPLSRAAMLARAKAWVKELEKQGVLQPDTGLVQPKEVYCSTSVGDFTKVATWAQWYGVQLGSDLANIDRKRFALVAIEQLHEGPMFCYGLLQRETGSLRHLFNIQINQVEPQMRKLGLKIPPWLNVTDLDHYRVG